jgi:hypothetical protein
MTRLVEAQRAALGLTSLAAHGPGTLVRRSVENALPVERRSPREGTSAGGAAAARRRRDGLPASVGVGQLPPGAAAAALAEGGYGDAASSAAAAAAALAAATLEDEAIEEALEDTGPKWVGRVRTPGIPLLGVLLAAWGFAQRQTARGTPYGGCAAVGHRAALGVQASHPSNSPARDELHHFLSDKLAFAVFLCIMHVLCATAPARPRPLRSLALTLPPAPHPDRHLVDLQARLPLKWCRLACCSSSKTDCLLGDKSLVREVRAGHADCGKACCRSAALLQPPCVLRVVCEDSLSLRPVCAQLYVHSDGRPFLLDNVTGMQLWDMLGAPSCCAAHTGH